MSGSVIRFVHSTCLLHVNSACPSEHCVWRHGMKISLRRTAVTHNNVNFQHERRFCHSISYLPIITLQKRNVRIISGFKSRNSCRNLSVRLEILSLPCEYIFTLLNFVVNNLEHFQTNSAIHSVNIRNRNYLHR
jgi:hypothetical protein